MSHETPATPSSDVHTALPTRRRILASLAGLAALLAVAAFGYRAWGQQELQSSVAELEAALGKEVDRTPEPEPEDDLLPILRRARALHETSLLAVAEGQIDLALRRAEEMAYLRRETLADPWLLHQLVARGIDAELLDLARAIIEAPDVNAEQLERLRALFPADEDEIGWSTSVAREASLAFRDYAPKHPGLRYRLNEPWERTALVLLWHGFAEASRAPVDDVQAHMRAKVGELPARLAPPIDMLIPNIADAALRHRGDLLARRLARRAVDLRLARLAGETPALHEPVDDPLSGGDVVLERTEDGWILDAVAARAFVRQTIPEPASPEAITVHDLPFVWRIPEAQ